MNWLRCILYSLLICSCATQHSFEGKSDSQRHFQVYDTITIYDTTIIEIEREKEVIKEILKDVYITHTIYDTVGRIVSTTEITDRSMENTEETTVESGSIASVQHITDVSTIVDSTHLTSVTTVMEEKKTSINFGLYVFVILAILFIFVIRR